LLLPNLLPRLLCSRAPETIILPVPGSRPMPPPAKPLPGWQTLNKESFNMQLADAYDEKAVAWIHALEETLDRHLPNERIGGFAAILSAIEYQVEGGRAHPIVLRHLGEALLALAMGRRSLGLSRQTHHANPLPATQSRRHAASRTIGDRIGNRYA